MPLKALVVDDHPVTRIGFKAAVTALGDIEVFEADCLKAAFDVVRQTPDIDMIIGDLGLGDSAGLATVMALREVVPNARFAVTSSELPAELMLECFELGVRWFIDKASSPGMITPVLQSMLEGESLVPASLLDAKARGGSVNISLEQFAQPARPNAPQPRGSLGGITGRQAETAALLARGLSNKQIAQTLGISPGTAKNYVARILEILDTPNRAQAALKLAQGAYGKRPPSPYIRNDTGTAHT